MDRSESAQLQPLLDSLGRTLPVKASARVPALASKIPNPQIALKLLDTFYTDLPWRLRPVDYSGHTLNAALSIFANSPFLSQVLLRYPELLQWALRPENLYRSIPRGELRSELGSIRLTADDAEAAELLARFKRMHLLHIGLRDFLGIAPLPDVAGELSTLADTIIQGAHDHARYQLVYRFGRPLCEADTGPIICYFVVLALGKHGGAELNYSSDIDLMYLYTGDGHTWGPVVTSNHDFSKQLATRLTKILSTMTPEGFNYRVDLRLRPEGAAGELIVPMAFAANYYFNRARDWELQMLIKARPVAGDMRLGQHFLDMVSPRIYSTTKNFAQIEKVAESRDRIQQKRAKDGDSRIDVKLDTGGIRDIEFLVQCLQRLHAGQDLFLRSGGTLFALHRLREKGYIATPEYARLVDAYQYLRTVEHRLQILDNKQTHVLPPAGPALDFLAKQMSLESAGLLSTIRRHFKTVSVIYERVIHSQAPELRDPTPAITGGQIVQEAEAPEEPEEDVGRWRRHLPHLRRVSPNLARAFSEVHLRRGERAFEHFLDRLVTLPDVIEALEAHPALIPAIADLVEHSPHLAGYLARFPEDVARVATFTSPGDAEPYSRRHSHPTVDEILASDVSADETTAKLRRFYRRGMFRVLARSILRRESIFDTLARSSDLAEWMVRAAYTIAQREILPDEPEMPMWIVALGRLGMREFDLGSDADVVFVIRDKEAARLGIWTKVANRVIDIISSYTRDGQMFSVDPRLRPMGRDGELVQTESQFVSYFAQRAEPWEALTYMKARTIAGDPLEGKRFLSELQEVAWHRFGLDSELAPMLAKMRERLEAQQGTSRPIKSGAGGYYDIDFILMYCRLRDAGLFFESLNTPERIEVSRSTQSLTDGQADFLLDAAAFFRSLDHAIRTATGTSSSALPSVQWQREVFSELLSRWSPIRAEARPLHSVLAEVQDQTRQVFHQVFSAG